MPTGHLGRWEILVMGAVYPRVALHMILSKQRHLCRISIMEKLPSHSKEVFGESVGLDQDQQRTRPTTATFVRRLCIAVVFLIGYYLLLLKPSPACDGHHNARPQKDSLDGASGYIENGNHGANLASLTPDGQKSLGQIKIPLEAHIMSKCPDAKACLQDLVLPAMEKVNDKVDFRLSFIAR